MCFILFTVTSIHNIEKYTKIRNLKNKIEGGTEHSRLKRESKRLDKSKEKWKRFSKEQIDWYKSWK